MTIIEDRAVTAALTDAEFEALHPRGADGRFIKKWSIIKFLKDGKWNYGQVIDFDKDGVDVTPTNLSGEKTGAAPITLQPGQIYQAPKAKAKVSLSEHKKQTGQPAKKVGGQGGSNPGGMYELDSPDPETGEVKTEKFYVKKAKSPQHGRNEALANALYEAAGVPVPEVRYDEEDQNIYSKIVPGKQDMADRLANPTTPENAAWLSQVRRNFAVDAWLANWDVFGLTWDNVQTSSEDGQPYRIDNGGSLLYRAQGAPKGKDFGGKVGELDSMKQGKRAKVYGSMTKEEELDGAQRVLAISPAEIKQLVEDQGLDKALADTLIARRAHIAETYGLPLPESIQPDEAQVPTTAPLVDPIDLAEAKNLTREWSYEVNAETLKKIVTPPMHVVKLPNGETHNLDGYHKGEWEGQIAKWASAFPGGKFRVKTHTKYKNAKRPEHGQNIPLNSLPVHRWHRGDKVRLTDSNGTREYAVIGGSYWDDKQRTFTVQEIGGGGGPVTLDLANMDANTKVEVVRWDPPAAVDTPISAGKAQGPSTGQAAPAAEAIKKDLVEVAKPSGKGMVIGDGTTAEPGMSVKSNVDGKTYIYVKKKGPYAVVTDPNADDPTEVKLKKANTLAATNVPAGQAPATPPSPKDIPPTLSKNGITPEVGQLATAADGHHGKIVMISPDKKFVFITDSNGKRKRKSAGTVEIHGDTGSDISTQGTPAVDPADQVFPPGDPDTVAAIQADKAAEAGTSGNAGAFGIPYGSTVDGSLPPGIPPKSEWNVLHTLDTGSLSKGNALVWVKHSDGSWATEPWNGQPFDAMVNDGDEVYLAGALSDGSLHAVHVAALSESDLSNKVITFNGNQYVAVDRTPSGDLIVQSTLDPSEYGIIPKTSINGSQTTVHIQQPGVGVNPVPGEVPDFLPVMHVPVGLDLDGDAQTLWQLNQAGNLVPGAQFAIDGENWLTVKGLSLGALMYENESGQSGSITLQPGGNQAKVFLKDSPPIKVIPESPPVDTDKINPDKLPHGKVVKVGDLDWNAVIETPDGKTVAVHDTHMPDDKGGVALELSDGTMLNFPGGYEQEVYNYGTWTNGAPLTVSGASAVDLLFKNGDGAMLKIGDEIAVVGDSHHPKHIYLLTPGTGEWSTIQREELAKIPEVTITPGLMSDKDLESSLAEFIDGGGDSSQPYIKTSQVPDAVDLAAVKGLHIAVQKNKILTAVDPDSGEVGFFAEFPNGKIHKWVDQNDAVDPDWTSSSPNGGWSEQSYPGYMVFNVTNPDNMVVFEPEDKQFTIPGTNVTVSGNHKVYESTGDKFWVETGPNNYSPVGLYTGTVSLSPATQFNEVQGHWTLIHDPDAVSAEAEQYIQQLNVDPASAGPPPDWDSEAMTALGWEGDPPGTEYMKVADPYYGDSFYKKNEHGAWEVDHGAAYYDDDFSEQQLENAEHWTKPGAAPEAAPEPDWADSIPNKWKDMPSGTEFMQTDIGGQKNYYVKDDDTGKWYTPTGAVGWDEEDIDFMLEPDGTKEKWTKGGAPEAVEGGPTALWTNGKYTAPAGTKMQKINYTVDGKPATVYYVQEPTHGDKWYPVKPDGELQTNAPTDQAMIDIIKSTPGITSEDLPNSGNVDVPPPLPVPEAGEADPPEGWTLPDDVPTTPGTKIKKMTNIQDDEFYYYQEPGETEWTTPGIEGAMGPQTVSDEMLTDAINGEFIKEFEDWTVPGGPTPGAVDTLTPHTIPVPNPHGVGEHDVTLNPGETLHVTAGGQWFLEKSDGMIYSTMASNHTVYAENGMETLGYADYPDLGEFYGDYPEDTLTKYAHSDGIDKEPPANPAPPTMWLKAGDSSQKVLDAQWDTISGDQVAALEPGDVVIEGKNILTLTEKPKVNAAGMFEVTGHAQSADDSYIIQDYGIQTLKFGPSQSVIKATAPEAPSTPTPEPTPTPVLTPSGNIGGPAAKPSAEDISAWGGKTTKDGYIPSPGMKVTGKGPMQGQIVSVSKDKTKATVLTSDGKKSTRLIEALTVDHTVSTTGVGAVAPAQMSEGQYLPVDTPSQAIEKLLADQGALRTGELKGFMLGGVRGGHVQLRHAKDKNGNPIIRAYFRLDPEQGKTLKAKLTGGPPTKGAYVKKFKNSHEVAIGDQLAMKASTSTPGKWRPLAGADAPTHTVSKVEDLGTGKSQVTLTNNATGETITAGFYHNKTIEPFTWDPNKIVQSSGSTLNADAKNTGWSKFSGRKISNVIKGVWDQESYNNPLFESAGGHDPIGSSGAETFRQVTADGAVIEATIPTGGGSRASDGFSAITIPAGSGTDPSAALMAALDRMGATYRPPNQRELREQVVTNLMTSLSFDSTKAMSLQGANPSDPNDPVTKDMFSRFGKLIGLSDVGWQDVLVGQDSRGQTTMFWSERVQAAQEKKNGKTFLVKSADLSKDPVNGAIGHIVNGTLPAPIRAVEGRSAGKSAGSDDKNKASYGGFFSALTSKTLPWGNPLWSTSGKLTIYYHPSAGTRRIIDTRCVGHDAWGSPPTGTESLKNLYSGTQMKDTPFQDGLPSDEVGFIALDTKTLRDQVLAELKAIGKTHLGDRPIEEVVITKAEVQGKPVSSLYKPPMPKNVRPLLEIPDDTSNLGDEHIPTYVPQAPVSVPEPVAVTPIPMPEAAKPAGSEALGSETVGTADVGGIMTTHTQAAPPGTTINGHVVGADPNIEMVKTTSGHNLEEYWLYNKAENKWAFLPDDGQPIWSAPNDVMDFSGFPKMTAIVPEAPTPATAAKGDTSSAPSAAPAPAAPVVIPGGGTIGNATTEATELITTPINGHFDMADPKNAKYQVVKADTMGEVTYWAYDTEATNGKPWRMIKSKPGAMSKDGLTLASYDDPFSPHAILHDVQLDESAALPPAGAGSVPTANTPVGSLDELSGAPEGSKIMDWDQGIIYVKENGQWIMDETGALVSPSKIMTQAGKGEVTWSEVPGGTGEAPKPTKPAKIDYLNETVQTKPLKGMFIPLAGDEVAMVSTDSGPKFYLKKKNGDWTEIGGELENVVTTQQILDEAEKSSSGNVYKVAYHPSGDQTLDKDKPKHKPSDVTKTEIRQGAINGVTLPEGSEVMKVKNGAGFVYYVRTGEDEWVSVWDFNSTSPFIKKHTFQSLAEDWGGGNPAENMTAVTIKKLKVEDLSADYIPGEPLKAPAKGYTRSVMVKQMEAAAKKQGQSVEQMKWYVTDKKGNKHFMEIHSGMFLNNGQPADSAPTTYLGYGVSKKVPKGQFLARKVNPDGTTGNWAIIHPGPIAEIAPAVPSQGPGATGEGAVAA